MLTVFLFAVVCVGTAGAVDVGSFDELKQAIENKEPQIYIAADIPLGENDHLPVIEHTVVIMPKDGDRKIYRTAANMTENVGMLTVGSNGHLTINKNGEHVLTLDGNCSHVLQHKQPLVLVNGGTFYLFSGNLTNNSATVSGAAVSLNPNSYFLMSGGSIYNNTAGEYPKELQRSGGGVYVMSGCTFILNDGVIANNTAWKNSGGVHCYVGDGGDRATVEIHGGQITNNTGKGPYGGVVIDSPKIEFVMDGGNITNNSPNGLYFMRAEEGTARISGGNITGNTGHGLGVSSRSTVIITGGYFAENTYGVQNYGGTITITGGKISENTDYGVYGYSGTGSTTITGGNITDNKHGIYINSGLVTITGGNITDNTNSGISVMNNGLLTLMGGNIAKNKNYEINFKGAQFNVSGICNIDGKVKLDKGAKNGGIISVIDDFEGSISNIDTAKTSGSEVVNLTNAKKPAGKYLNHFRLTTKHLNVSLDAKSLVVSDSDSMTTPQTLTVVDGTPTTSSMKAGENITIAADSPANSWQRFYKWTSTVVNVVEDSNAMSTKVWMQNKSTTVSANYIEIDTVMIRVSPSEPYYPDTPLEMTVTASNSSTGIVFDTYPFEITCNGVAIGTDNKTGTPVLYTPQEVGTYILNVTLSARTVITEEITISVVSPPSQPSSSSTSQGSSVWLMETQTPTPTPTETPTQTDTVPTDIPDVKPTQTPDSSMSILGILAGLGVAVAGLRRR